MRKTVQFIGMIVLTAGFSAAGTMTGWISDATCGASNAKSDKASRDCAEMCLKNGAAPVFVNSADNKVYKLSGNVESVKAHMAYKVHVSGDVKNDTLNLKSIQKAK